MVAKQVQCAIGALVVCGPDQPRHGGAYPPPGTLAGIVTRKLGFASSVDSPQVFATWKKTKDAALYNFNDEHSKRTVLQFFRDVVEFAPRCADEGGE